MAPLKRNRYKSVEKLIEDIESFQAGKRTCGRKVFAAGEHLIRDGDDSKETYVIISGSVEVQRNVNGRAVTLSVMGPGEIVGEMAGITHSLRTATVIARDTTETLIITNNLMFEELQKLAPWMEKIVFSLAERVRVMSSHVHPILLEKRSFPIIEPTVPDLFSRHG